MPIQEPVTLSDCVFCEIVGGTAPSSSVYADGVAVAFMDIQPVNEGHILIVPRVHAACLAELDAETGAHLFRVAMYLSRAVRQSAVLCEGVNLFLADGQAAGQEVFHVHLHLIPRYRGDGFGFRFGPNYGVLPERARLEEIAADIRQALEGGRHAL
jgi:histidine triad (HIT) family protein